MAFNVKNCCIVLLLDASYIVGARTLISSFRHSEILPNLPIVLMSDDQKVLDDPHLGPIAHKKVLIEADFLERYANLSNEHIPESQRRENVPKYTWLKFAAYQNFGFDANMFIDTDMIFLRSPDGLLKSLEGANFDYAATQNIPHEVWKGVENAEQFGDLWRKFEGELDPFSACNLVNKDTSFNSGFSIARGKVLGYSYIERLFRIAADSNTQFEQRINWFAMREIAVKFMELPIFINMTRPILDQAMKFDLKDIIDSTIIQHYTSKKPWQKSDRYLTESDKLWIEEWNRIDKA